MIVCQNCKHKNMAGSMFCSECGANIAALDPISTQNIATGEMRQPVEGKGVKSRQPVITKLDTWGTLHLMDTGQMLPLSDRNEFTLGRISEGQPIMPDIDLSPYQAYGSGVSRLHAVLKRDGNRILVMDLGSSNGTYLNAKRLNPNMEQAIQHGDILALGKLKIQIILQDI
jgi:hypothetical protein